MSRGSKGESVEGFREIQKTVERLIADEQPKKAYLALAPVFEYPNHPDMDQVF